MRQDLEKLGHRFSQSGTLTQSGNSHERFIRITESAHYLWGFKGSRISRTRFPLCVQVHLGLYSPYKPIKVIATHSGHTVKKSHSRLPKPWGLSFFTHHGSWQAYHCQERFFFSMQYSLVMKGQGYNVWEIWTGNPAQSLMWLRAGLLTSPIWFLHLADGQKSF